MCHGIGKGKMLKTVKAAKCSLSLLGDINASMEHITKQATAFMCKCYNVANAPTMTEARIKVWTTRTGRKAASKVPKLCSLPPTSEAFEENVKRAHFQCGGKHFKSPQILILLSMGGLRTRKQNPFNQSCFHPQGCQHQIIFLNLFAVHVPQKDHAIRVDVGVWQPI